MTRFHVGVTLAIVMLVAAVGGAQSADQADPTAASPPPVADGRRLVAVLDLVRIFDECAQIKALNEIIQKKTEEITKEANQRREVIETKQFELKQAFRPGTQDYNVRRKELMQLNIDANVWFKLTEEEVEQDRFHWTRVIYEQAASAAAEVARERGFDVVLQRTEFRPLDPGVEQNVQVLRRMIQERQLVYHVPEVDITNTVIRRLDAAYQAAGGKKQLDPATGTKP